MQGWIDWTTGYLWANALAVMLPAALVALLTSGGRCRPATRHALWLTVLLLFIVPPVALPTFFSGGKRVESEPTTAPPSSNDHAAALNCPLIETPPRTGVDVEDSALASLAWTPPAARHPSPTLEASSDSPAVESAAAAPIAEHPVLVERAPCAPDGTPEFFTAPDRAAAVHAAQTMPGAPPKNATNATIERFAGTTQTLAPLAGTWLTLRGYAAGWVGAVRFAASRIPQMPTSVWILGTALIVAARLASISRGRRLLAASRRAPQKIERLTARCARQLGLRARPAVRMIDRACPPMVLGLWRTHLLLPVSLWDQLDPVGRQAILLHELAHVRRRDLWVRWLERLIAALCWWHPVVWYARHRLNEEAEHCCDAWVTWLLPGARRRYATALLQSQTFVNSSHPVDPAVGIGVVSVRAKRLARRLTMVMTHPSRPALSAGGVLTVAALALAGWFSAPAWAGFPGDAVQTQPTPAPAPDEPVSPEDAEAVPEEIEVVELDVPGAPVIVETQPRVAYRAASPAATLAPLVATMPIGQSGDKAMEERMRRLEAQLHRLEAQLERIGAVPAVEGAVNRSLLPPASSRVRTARPSAPRQATRPATPRAPMAQRGGVGFGRSQGGGAGGSAGGQASAGEQPMVSRTYKLSQGKLEALLNLMARQDVPIFVARRDEGIEVTATARQHEIFSAFVAMIDPDNRRASADDEATWDLIATTEAAEAGALAAELRARELAMVERERALHQHAHAEDQVRAAEELRAAAAAQRQAVDKSRHYSEGYSLYNQGDYVSALDSFRRSADVNHLRGESLYNMACCEALLGNPEESLDLLEQAWEAGYHQLEHIQQDDDLNTLRDDERYKAFVEKRSKAAR